MLAQTALDLSRTDALARRLGRLASPPLPERRAASEASRRMVLQAASDRLLAVSRAEFEALQRSHVQALARVAVLEHRLGERQCRPRPSRTAR